MGVSAWAMVLNPNPNMQAVLQADIGSLHGTKACRDVGQPVTNPFYQYPVIFIN